MLQVQSYWRPAEEKKERLELLDEQQEYQSEGQRVGVRNEKLKKRLFESRTSWKPGGKIETKGESTPQNQWRWYKEWNEAALKGKFSHYLLTLCWWRVG